MRVILYCRVSSDEQADGTSLDFQERVCESIAVVTIMRLYIVVERIFRRNITIFAVHKCSG